MKAELRKRVVEKTDLIFIADDGKEFRDEDSCRRYESELQKKAIEEKIKGFEISGAEDMIPPVSDASEFSKYHWYFVQNDEQAEMLNEYYDGFLYCEFPEVICVEIYESDDVYIHYLNDITEQLMDLFDRLGYEAKFTKKETE